MVRKFALLFLIATPAFGQDCDGIYRDPNWLPLHMSNDYLQVVTPDHWHLLTKSHVGTISLIKNLTEHECQFARARVLGLPATDEEEEKAKRRREIEFPKCVELYQSESGSTPRNSKIWEEWKRANPAAKGCTGPEGTTTIWSSTTHVVNDGDIETAECFK